MTDKTSFAEATDPKAEAAQESAAPTQEPQADQQVALVVGERAFATMDDVKKKISHADEHIGTLEGENQKLKEQLEEAMSKLQESKSLDEVLQKVEEAKQGSAQGLTPEQIEELVSNKITTTKQADQHQSNLKECISAAEQAYGDGFIEKMTAMANDLGLAMTDVDKMAAENPKLFAKTFLPNGSKSAPAHAHQSSVRTSIYDEAPRGFEVKAPLSMNAKERTNHFIEAVEAKLKQI